MPNDLKGYLERIYEMERSLYEQESIFNNIESKINAVSNYSYKDTEAYYEKDSFSDNCFLFLGLVIPGGIVGGILGGCYGLYEIFRYFKSGVFFPGIVRGFGIGVIIGLIVFIVMIIADHIRRIKHNKQTAYINKQIVAQNEMNKNIAKQKIQLLREEQNNIKNFYHKTKEVLNEYYACNIIFPKYRNLIAISSFYEYFASGRCSQLEGHEGAYNIFENEIRQNTIISKLDDVIDKLDTIIDNQYMLYSAIQESNQRTKQLTGVMYQLSDKLSNISQNAEICAYNSEITAQNTTFLKWLEFYRG